MRALSNVEQDPAALKALSAEIADFCLRTRYLLIPSPEQLTDIVILLRRLVLISHKVLAIKAYYNLLRDLQRIVMTSAVLAHERTKDMPEGTAEEIQAKREAYEQYDAQFNATLAAHPIGEVEGEHIASLVRHRLCTEDVFCAACSFLQVEVSKRGSIYYIRGESPQFSETKKNRDPLVMHNEITLKTLASNLARPDLERGGIEQTQITYGFNLLAKLYQLFVMMPVVIQWMKEGEHLANPRRKVDVRVHFDLTLREYDSLMVMARQMGMTTIKARKTQEHKWTLNAKQEERVLAHALATGVSPNRALNALLQDLFQLIDARRRAQALKPTEAPAEVPAAAPAAHATTAAAPIRRRAKNPAKQPHKDTRNGKSRTKRRT